MYAMPIENSFLGLGVCAMEGISIQPKVALQARVIEQQPSTNLN
jgi:hypothetical protein